MKGVLVMSNIAWLPTWESFLLGRKFKDTALTPNSGPTDDGPTYLQFGLASWMCCHLTWSVN